LTLSSKSAVKQKKLAGKLLQSRRYRPDDLVFGIAPHLKDEKLNIGGFYLFSSSQVDDTLAWRAEMLERLV